MVNVDKEKCIGCGACAAVCPDCFEIIDGVSNVKSQDCDCGEMRLEDVADACPVDAISVDKQ